jgi:hypothetical protein
VHQLGLKLFGAMLWKSLISEVYIFNKNLNKIETENCIGF